MVIPFSLKSLAQKKIRQNNAFNGEKRLCHIWNNVDVAAKSLGIM
jgi:hypothetical protein